MALETDVLRNLITNNLADNAAGEISASDVRQILQMVASFIDEANYRSARIFGSRQGAVDFLTNNSFDPDVLFIATVESGGLMVRGKSAGATDPLFDAVQIGGDRWGVSVQLPAIGAITAAVTAEAQAREQAINSAVSSEAQARTQAISAEAQARAQAISAEATARNEAISAEAQARTQAIGSAIATAEAGDLRVMAEDRTVVFVGASRAVIDANAAASSANLTNWVFPIAATEAGDAGRFRAQMAVAGVVRFGVFRDAGASVVRVRFRDIILPEGYVDVPVGLEMEAGEYLGAFMGTARVRFVSGGGTGYYFNSSASEQTTIAKSPMNTTNLLVAQFVVYQGSSPAADDRAALLSSVSDLSGRVERLEYGGRDLESFVMTDDARLADPAASPAAAWNFVFDSVRPAGNVVRVEFWARNAGTVRLGVYGKASSTFSRRDYVDLVATVGYNLHEIDLEVRAGEYIGYRPTVAIVPFQSNSPLGTETGVWFNGSGSDLSSFTATLNANQQHLIKITQAIGAAQGATGGADIELSEARVSNVAFAQTGNDIEVTVTAVDTIGSATTATATFAIPATSATFRYDIIAYDHGTNTLSRLTGTERNDAANVQPVVSTPGQQGVLRVRVGTGGITSAIPIPEMSGAVPLKTRSRADRRFAEARRRCPKTADKIRRRQPLRFLGYGDSITQLRRGTGSAPQTTANGSDRDAISGVYLTGSGVYDPAAIAAIPLYTAVQLGRPDDAAGAVHTRIGINWGLVEALEARGYVLGTDLWYDNLGIAGTSSSDMWDDATDQPKAWLAAIPTAAGVGNKPDLVVYANAMNERGYAVGREARNFKAVNWIRSQGIEVIIVGCALSASGIASTRWTNAMLARVARATGSGYLPLEDLWEADGLGLNPEDTCHANRNVNNNANHPGTIELTRYSRLLGEVFS